VVNTTPTKGNVHLYKHYPIQCAGGTVAQVALAWLLRQPAVASVVIGATTLAQLESNIQAAFLQLSEEQVQLYLDIN
jgi:aryl-alcohol dehydrogenase-like predicted oxidoreductase